MYAVFANKVQKYNCLHQKQKKEKYLHHSIGRNFSL